MKTTIQRIKEFGYSISIPFAEIETLEIISVRRADGTEAYNGTPATCLIKILEFMIAGAQGFIAYSDSLTFRSKKVKEMRIEEERKALKEYRAELESLQMDLDNNQ